MNAYTNPISLPSLPRGSDPGKSICDYRSISDPSVYLFNNKWYLYPSYGMTWVSDNFVSWDYVPCNIPCSPGYSPAVVEISGKYYLTRHSDGLYIADSPTGPFEYIGDFIMPDGSKMRPVDPALFKDDDGSVYLYCFDSVGGETSGGESYTLGMRLDSADPQKVITEPVILNRFTPSHIWERFGANWQDDRWGWIEGQWMLKHNGRYYLIYAANGTQFPSYAMGAYYSDEGPLSGFVYQKRNPIIGKRDGIVRGGGHGSIVHAPDNSLWAFYTIPMCYAHVFERRIGMDRIEVDENGELYCSGMTETPQYGPCQESRGELGLSPLNFFQRGNCSASSHSEGHEEFFAIDDSLMTFWLPLPDDEEPCLDIDLSAVYNISGSRIIWRDVGLDYNLGITPKSVRYQILVSEDGDRWTTALDASDNDIDLSIDNRIFDTIAGRFVRLGIKDNIGNPRPGVVNFTVFGKRETYEEEIKRKSETAMNK